VHEWATNGQGTGNVGLRMPETVIGIDVDAYGGKPGAATLADAEARLGPLPPSPVSTSRDDGSGIRFYRVPPGRCWADVVGPGVEVVHHGHRYAVAAPSVHPEGRPYRWLDADGNQVPGPAVDDLPALPPAWVDELDRGSVDDRVRKVEVSGAEVTETLAAMPAGDPCPYVGRVLAAAEAKLADAASRHDVTRNDVLRIVRAGHQGHEGARVALDTLEGLWRAALRQGTPRDPDPGEWARSVSGAVAIVVADPTPEADRGCCTPPAKVPSEADDGYDPDALEDAHLSQRIAVDWLERRYCWAAGLGWLRWDSRRWKPLSDAGITEVVRKALRK